LQRDQFKRADIIPGYNCRWDGLHH